MKRFIKKWINQNKACVLLHGINHDLYEFEKDSITLKQIKQAIIYLEKLCGYTSCLKSLLF